MPKKDAATPEPAPTTTIDEYVDSVQHQAAKHSPPHVAGALAQRAEEGFKKYGTFLGKDNGRDVMRDAMQEALDLVVYLKQAELEEIPTAQALFWKAMDLADILVARCELTEELDVLAAENKRLDEQVDNLQDQLELFQTEDFQRSR